MQQYCLLFPGQGSQYVGMAKSFLELLDVKDLVEKVNDALDFSLTNLMLNGPIEELSKTEIAQPAILFHSYLSFLHLKNTFPKLKITSAIGHSLGEYSALVCAESLDLIDAIKIVRLRGQLMQEAVPKEKGAMAAILGLSADIIENALKEFKDEKNLDYVTIANFNSPLQTVISGTFGGVQKAITLLKSLGAKKALMLNVSAPFHSALMNPAEEKLIPFIERLNFKEPKFPIISTSLGETLSNAANLKESMLTQIVKPVLFSKSILLSQNKNFIEVGPGKVLSGLVKRIDQDLLVQNVDALGDIKNINA